MAAIPEMNMEELFVPQADLTIYETMTGRELYFALMKGAFSHQGIPTDDEHIIGPNLGGTWTKAINEDDITETDSVIPVAGAENRTMRVQTSVVEGVYPGIDWSWGPRSTVTLSTLKDERTISLSARASQEHQEFVIDAWTRTFDALTGKSIDKGEGEGELVGHVWVGNTGDIGASEENARRVFNRSLFRQMTPAEKRVFGVALEGLGQLAIVAV